ncbi:MAG TPA: hypothetical protein VF551_03145, partial [Chthoniobacterales bacterium]
MILSLAKLRSGAAVLFVALLLASAFTTSAKNISPLANEPDWASLERYQETMTRDEFAGALQNIYCTRGASPELIEVSAETARLLIDREAQTWFTLR